jgi:hypothetical protein
MAENNNVLKLYKGEAHKIRVEEAEEFEKSYFLDAYKQAFGCFGDIHLDNQRYQESPESRATKREFNNVIAFCGERGSGKTSAMMSFRNALRNWENDHGKINNLLPGNLNTAGHFQFVCLDAVDPSRFEPNDRLSGTVLSELYRRYQEKAQKGDLKNHEAQRKLEKSFSDFLKGIQLLSNSKPFGEQGRGESDFEVLAGIAGAAGLRKTFHALVENYLRYELDEKSGSDLKNTYLVIPVDDLDLSVEHAFNLAEDIRKYMHVPNVIILIAMKLDQLRLAVEQANYVRFEGIRKASNRPDRKYVEEMSNMYMEKLVPVSKRVLLPILGNLKDAKRQLIYFGPKIDNPGGDYIEKILLDKIKEKTLLDLRDSTTSLNPIVPMTIREIQNFLEFLDQLPDCDFNASNRRVNAPGLSRFIDYFFEFWVPSSLEREQEAIIYALRDANYASKNSVAAYHLGIQLRSARNAYPTFLDLESKPTKGNTTKGESNSDDDILGMKNHEELPRIVSPNNTSFNVSLGDVLFLLNELSRIDKGKQSQTLIFAIKAYYNIEIVQLLIERSQSAPNVVEGSSNLGDLIGGSYFSPWSGSRILTNPRRNDTQYSNAWSLAKSSDRFVIEGKISHSTEPTRKLSILRYLWEEKHEVWDSDKASRFAEGQSDRLPPFIAFFSFFYFGNEAKHPKFRELNYRWYLQPSNLITSLAIPSTVIVDFKSFWFWNLVPEISIFRMFSHPNDKHLNTGYYDEADLDYGSSVNEDGDNSDSTKNKLLSSFNSTVNWLSLIRIYQIGPMESIWDMIGNGISKDAKNSNERRFSDDLGRVLEHVESSIRSFLAVSHPVKAEGETDKRSAENWSTVMPWIAKFKNDLIKMATSVDRGIEASQSAKKSQIEPESEDAKILGKRIYTPIDLNVRDARGIAKYKRGIPSFQEMIKHHGVQNSKSKPPIINTLDVWEATLRNKVFKSGQAVEERDESITMMFNEIESYESILRSDELIGEQLANLLSSELDNIINEYNSYDRKSHLILNKIGANISQLIMNCWNSISESEE